MVNQRKVSVLLVILSSWLALVACAINSQAGPTSEAPVENQAIEEKEAVYQSLKEAVTNMEAGNEKSLNVFVGEDKGVVQQGDYVILSYIAKLADGTPVSLLAGGDNSQAVQGASKKMAQALVLAGDQQTPMGLGERLTGGGIGSQGTVNLPPEKAFGRYDEKKIISIDRTRTLPAALTMAAEDYFHKFRSLPKEGETVPYNPYVEARIEKVADDTVELRLFPKSKEPVEESFGDTHVRADNAAGKIIVRMNPKVGASIYQGKIVEVKQDKVIVDMNHPHVDQAVEISYMVEKIVKPSTFGNKRIEWLEDFKQGREASADLKRPILLFLYADWCQYCEKMFSATFKDPWVNYFKDEYVWVKINSDQNKAFMKAFGQKGFPLTVLMTPDGKILEKWSGYKKTVEVRQGLIKVLNNYNAIAS
jgi:FKBP-type peptidyl-prolyl cis-trans isomerase 2